jgi:hypothetical protein
MGPSKWERHTGSRKKKWKQSIKLKNTNITLLSWVNIKLKFREKSEILFSLSLVASCFSKISWVKPKDERNTQVFLSFSLQFSCFILPEIWL